MKYLTISNEVKIPLDVVTKRLAFVGTTGSGKSYGAMKLAEEMLDAGIQVITLDPVGIHWGLRISANKKAAGFPITVFGGLYGDVPITPQSGALIADVIIDKVISAVIDVSQFEHDAEKARFASAFAARFFFRKKAKPSPVHIFLEEGQEFVPQNPQREETTMQHNFVRMSKIGRNFGIGVSIITQRPQEVSKKALNLSQALFAFQTNGHHERKAIEEWIKDKGLDLDIASDLPKLPIGQPHLWSPGWLKVSLQVKILKRKTFHPSEEQSASYEPLKLNNLSPVDIAKLSESIKETVEKAKDNDPAELKRKIAELQAKVKKLEAVPAKVDVKSTEAEVARQVASVAAAYKAWGEKVQRAFNGMHAEISVILQTMTEMGKLNMPEMPALNSLHSSKNYSVGIPAPARPQVELKPRGLGKIPVAAASGEINTRILHTIAMLAFRGIDANRKSVARWMGIHPNGGRYNTDLAILRSEGHLKGFNLTTGIEIEIGTTGITGVMEALKEETQRKLFRTINEMGPLDKASLAAALGIHPNGGRFNTDLGWLRSMGVITQRGMIDTTEGARR